MIVHHNVTSYRLLATHRVDPLVAIELLVKIASVIGSGRSTIVITGNRMIEVRRGLGRS